MLELALDAFAPLLDCRFELSGLFLDLAKKHVARSLNDVYRVLGGKAGDLDDRSHAADADLGAAEHATERGIGHLVDHVDRLIDSRLGCALDR